MYKHAQKKYFSLTGNLKFPEAFVSIYIRVDTYARKIEKKDPCSNPLFCAAQIASLTENKVAHLYNKKT